MGDSLLVSQKGSIACRLNEAPGQEVLLMSFFVKSISMS